MVFRFERKASSNWNASGLADVLQAKAAQEQLQRSHMPNADINPAIRALLVLDRSPRVKPRGYKPPESRVVRRYVTSMYMREYYREVDKSRRTRLRLKDEVLRTGNDEGEDDMFDALTGDDLARQWAEARINELYRRAEVKWYDQHGQLIEVREAQRRAREALEWGADPSMTQSRHRFDQDETHPENLEGYPDISLNDDAISPAALQKLKEKMYSEFYTEKRDLSAPEYVYYEDPSYGAFDALTSGLEGNAEIADEFVAPVIEETAASRLDRVALRNRAQALTVSSEGQDVSKFLREATGLSTSDAQRLLSDRISKNVVVDKTEQRGKYDGKQVEPGGHRPVYEAHLSRRSRLKYGGK